MHFWPIYVRLANLMHAYFMYHIYRTGHVCNVTARAVGGILTKRSNCVPDGPTNSRWVARFSDTPAGLAPNEPCR